MIVYIWLLYFSTIRPNTASIFVVFVSTLLFDAICGCGGITPFWGDAVDAAAAAATSCIGIWLWGWFFFFGKIDDSEVAALFTFTG